MLRILSGTGQATWSESDTRSKSLQENKRYQGTVVDVQFSIDPQIDLASVLSFGVNPTPYTPADMIELKYLSDDSQRLTVRVAAV
jgi:hypothetical protein